MSRIVLLYHPLHHSLSKSPHRPPGASFCLKIHLQALEFSYPVRSTLLTMTHDVTRWLDEIKALRQQVTEAQQEREQAFASASNWQRLYETEAQQRRADVALSRQTIERLKLEIQQLQGNLVTGEDSATTLAGAIWAEVEKLQTPEELRQKLREALAERDRLIQALKTEQINHAQTRKGLTTALGDAIDMLSKKEER